MSYERIVDCSGTTVGYATDVEGNLAFWNKYVAHSAVLSKVDDSLVLKSGCHFVYGGDSCDRGCGDLQVLSDLVSLKERYPERVHLLMGNRDINKLRFTTAMSPEVLSLKPECYFGLQTADISNNPDYKLNDRVSKMQWILVNTMGSPFAFEYRRQELQRSNLPSSDLDVTDSFCGVVDLQEGLMLRYLEQAQVVVILGDVMFLHGAIHDFNQGFIPYTTKTRPGYVDGPISCTDMPLNHTLVEGYVVDDPFEWCEKINAFAASEIRDFKENITSYLALLSAEIARRKDAVHAKLGITDTSKYTDRELAEFYYQHSGLQTSDGPETGIGASLLHDQLSGYFHPQPGSGLIMYGMGQLAYGVSTRSVIYSSYLHQGRPRPCSAAVADWLLQPRPVRGESGGGGLGGDGNDGSSGDDVRCRSMRRIVVGHQPHADAPLILQAHGLQIFSADSSYSINTQWPVSQLDAMFLPTTDKSSVSDPTAYTVPVARSDEVYMSFSDYADRTYCVGGIRLLNDNATASDNSAGIAVPTSAETRSPQCITELLFHFGIPDDSDVDVCSSGVVHGCLSQGSAYNSTLDNVNRGAHQCDVYVGRETKDGWYVKATGVHLPTGCASVRQAAAASEAYYLLAHSAGYCFRNKLVASADIATHF